MLQDVSSWFLGNGWSMLSSLTWLDKDDSPLLLCRAINTVIIWMSIMGTHSCSGFHVTMVMSEINIRTQGRALGFWKINSLLYPFRVLNVMLELKTDNGRGPGFTHKELTMRTRSSRNKQANTQTTPNKDGHGFSGCVNSTKVSGSTKGGVTWISPERLRRDVQEKTCNEDIEGLAATHAGIEHLQESPILLKKHSRGLSPLHTSIPRTKIQKLISHRQLWHYNDSL